MKYNLLSDGLLQIRHHMARAWLSNLKELEETAAETYLAAENYIYSHIPHGWGGWPELQLWARLTQVNLVVMDEETNIRRSMS